MPFNVATIKDKAVSAKNATVTKIQDTRDKHSSTPMARTRFAEGGYVPKAPPPPPPGVANRTSFNSPRSSASLERDDGEERHGYGYAPPQVARNTKPTLNASTERSTSTSTSPPPPPPSRGSSILQRAKAFGAQLSPAAPTISPAAPSRWSQQASKRQETAVEVDKIDWASLSHEDKQIFFSWLDEFFAYYIEKMHGVSLGHHARREEDATEQEVGKMIVEPPSPPSVSDATVITARGPPPPIRVWSKPTTPSVSSPSHSQSSLSMSLSQPQSDFTSSYPPSTTHGSQALDLAYYFHPSTSWSSSWYSSSNAIPPQLQSNPHRLYKAQMISRGDFRTLSLAALFCDLSIAWVSVSFSGSTSRVTERAARYLGVPGVMQEEELRRESEVYGETIANFAESFLGSGQFCARGECWDLAAEALRFITSDGSLPTPVPSLGRTHGHLIFVGKANGRGRGQEGRWRGGDDRVRRGDIVEWRSVRIARIGDPPGGYAILGDPEHTAVITRDSVPSSQVFDGASVEPRALKTLEVVEQSRNDPPEPVRRTYDLSRFEEGEVWIYRPVGMQVYLGYGELECEAPPHALSI